MIDYKQLLKKNEEYQKALIEMKEFIEQKIEYKRKQIKQLDEILEMIPIEQQEYNQKEKCTAYLTLQILHDSKQRKIYQYNSDNSKIEETFFGQEVQQDYLRKIVDLQRKKNLILWNQNFTQPRFRQQCKKKIKPQNASQLQPKKISQMRQIVLSEIVNCLTPDGANLKWSLIAMHATQLLNLHTSDQYNITPMEIYRVWLKKFQQLYTTTFTQIEDETLTKLVQLCGDNQWAYIAKLITTKTSIQLRERWFKCLNKSIKRKRWSIYEDLKLVVLIDYFGVGQWNKLHQFFQNRTEVQIRERWCNVLDPSLEVREWSEEEEKKLLQLHGIHGNAWSIISLELNRTDNECRRRYQLIDKNTSDKKQSNAKIDYDNDNDNDNDSNSEYQVQQKKKIAL